MRKKSSKKPTNAYGRSRRCFKETEAEKTLQSLRDAIRGRSRRCFKETEAEHLLGIDRFAALAAVAAVSRRLRRDSFITTNLRSIGPQSPLFQGD